MPDLPEGVALLGFHGQYGGFADDRTRPSLRSRPAKLAPTATNPLAVKVKVFRS